MSTPASYRPATIRGVLPSEDSGVGVIFDQPGAEPIRLKLDLVSAAKLVDMLSRSLQEHANPAQKVARIDALKILLKS